MQNDNFHIITGGPGVGKTTLLDSFISDGYTVIPEAAREIIKEQAKRDGNGVPWKDNRLYTELMINRSIADYKDAAKGNNDRPVFFDRGIPDSLCHWELCGNPFLEEMEKSIRDYRYGKIVFILPPWKEIYHTDSERKQSWEEAEYTYHKMMEVYKRYDYKAVIVPIGTIEYRKRFILSNI